jgi:hypothetical protein
LSKADWDRIEAAILARAAKSANLPLDKNHATIVPVAVPENPQTTMQANEPAQPTQALTRPNKLAPLPRRGGGWIKKW